MIDFTRETTFPLSQASRKVPRRGSGKRLHTATFYRWAAVGCRGVKLETLQIGGTKCTSAEALQRFFERLSNAGDSSLGPMANSTHRDKPGRRQADETDRLLDKLGL
jgi:hypothetical protein